MSTSTTVRCAACGSQRSMHSSGFVLCSHCDGVCRSRPCALCDRINNKAHDGIGPKHGAPRRGE